MKTIDVIIPNDTPNPHSIRLGRAVRWNRKHLEAWLEAGGPPREQWELSRRGKK